jgi:hypothetical protein
MTKPRKITARWRSPLSKPEKDGWYEVLAPDDRWDGQPNWRLYRNGCWWKECEGEHFIPYVTEPRYRWRGDPKPARLRYAQVSGRKGDGEGCA